MLRFLHKFSKAVNGFFLEQTVRWWSYFSEKKEVIFLIHTVARGRRGVRDRMGMFLTNSSRGVGLILLSSSNF